MSLDRNEYAFQSWKPHLIYNNDMDAKDSSFFASRTFLYDTLTSLHQQLQQYNSEYSSSYNDDILFVHTQLVELLDYLFITYEKSKVVKILSVNLDTILAKTITFNLNIMMKNGHEKFTILIIELVNKLSELVLSNVKKISISKNWYSSLKHLSIIILKFIYTKFNGFLNNTKSLLVTGLYKHLSKLNESYNSAIENGHFKSNYFSDMVHLIDIILAHDNSNIVLDEKLLGRLFKLVKFLTQRNPNPSDPVFTYPLTSVLHGFSILTSILKSDRYVTSTITNKKVPFSAVKYVNSINTHLNLIISSMDTDHKKLKLTLTKNLADLLVFTYVVFGSNVSAEDDALKLGITLLFNEYKLTTSSSNLKSALIETLIQFLSKLNLYYQSERIKLPKFPNSVNFISLKFFTIINLIYCSLFELQNSSLSSKRRDINPNHILINDNISLNYAIKTLNHLELIHVYLIKELDNDTNKLIVLSKLVLSDFPSDSKFPVKTLQEAISENHQNVWYISNILKFAQLIIDDLDEYVLSGNGSFISSDMAAQLVLKIADLCFDKNFRIRVIAVETLVKLLKIKPDMSFSIMNNSLEKLIGIFDAGNNGINTFNETYSNAYLIASILSYTSKEYITSDFILKVFSISFEALKKFNTSVISSNLFGSNNGVNISNFSYEKQLVSCILLLGLFNYASGSKKTDPSTLFLQDSSQFLNIWKNLLAHSLPNGFLQLSDDSKAILNIGEVMKILEIKNQSLVCVVTYINYLTSINDSLDGELVRQLTQILTKSYTFITQLYGEVKTKKVPEFFSNALTGNKLRIFEAYLKLLPHVNIKNELNSTMLIEIVQNFSDVEKYRYEFKDPYGKVMKTSKKKIQINEISEYLLYYIDDGVWYGMTSKFNNFKIDELMIKDHAYKFVNRNSESEIDLAPYHNQFLIESPNLQSNLSNISVFDETTESRNYTFLNHSLLHDSFMLLYNNSYDVGYTDTMKYPVPTDTMTIDTSIELFAISFGYLTPKVQISVLESIRSNIFYESKETILSNMKTNSNFDETDEKKIKQEFSLMLRKKAISVNSSISLHSLLNYMARYNSKAETSLKLRLKKEVAHLIIETLKNISFEDVYMVNLNSESIGLCCSLVDGMETQEELLHNEVAIMINAIAENNIPNVRAFYIKSLAQLTKYSNMINTSKITSTIFTLLKDPHPVVHGATLQALDTFMNGKSNLEVSNDLIHKVLIYLEKTWLDDNFGIRSETTVSSNINFREYSNSVNWMVKLLRSLVNVSGPAIRMFDEDLKSQLNKLLFNFQYLVHFDYEIVVRELLKIYEQLLVFDKSIIDLNNYKFLTRLLIINNFKTGVYGHSLAGLPFDDEYDNENTIECFPCTTSQILLEISLESAFQLFKLEDNEIIDSQYEQLLWIALESDPDNESIKNIVRILMDECTERGTEERYTWFTKLVKYYNINKSALVSPLMKTFEKRINNAGMYFHMPVNDAKPSTLKTPKVESKRTQQPSSPTSNPDALNEAEETLTSPSNIKKNFNDNSNDDGDNDDDDDADDNDIVYNTSDSSNSNFENWLDLSNDQVSWKFRLFVMEMLNKLLTFCEFDDRLKLLLSKKINEFVRIAFTSSTSNLVTLRITSLKLLGNIIHLYSDMKDPLYPDISILDQQQAQIMSAIIPSFNKESTIELAGEGIVLSSRFISSNITNVKKAPRIIKILTTSLEDLANSHNSKGTMKIGDISILTKKSEDKIKTYILQAWSKMLILSEENKNDNGDLVELLQVYSKVLITLWVHSLREYAMNRYSLYERAKPNIMSEGFDLQVYENCWIDFVESICIVIDNQEYYNYLIGILGDDIGKLFMTIFGLCIEYLTKRSNKPVNQFNSEDIRILRSLKKLFKLELSIKILFNEHIFSEFVDIINKLISISTDAFSVQLLNSINELLKEIYLDYFDDLKLNDQNDKRSVEEIYSEFDKLFELLRLIIKIVSTKLTFIKDKEILDRSTIVIDDSDFMLIKKCFSSFIEMINKLPMPIQIDLYSCLMYMLILIHEFNNPQLTTMMLPVIQRGLINYRSLAIEMGNENSIVNIKSIFKIFNVKEDSKEDQLLTFIIIKNVPDIIIDASDVDLISKMIVSGLNSSDSNLVSLSVQTVKSIIHNSETGTSANILRKLFPLLIEILSDSGIQISEPRLIVEIFVTYIKTLTDDIKIESMYELILPILVFFNSKFGYEEYVHSKLIELVDFNTEIFKETIQNSEDELKSKIQLLLKKAKKVEVDAPSNELHIELKTLG